MMKFSGSVDRTFDFPDGRKNSFDFFADLPRIVSLFSDIEIDAISSQDPSVFRLAYHSTEMGVYEVRAICDVRMIKDEEKFEIKLIPAAAKDFPPVKAEMTPQKTRSVGELNAILTMLDENGETTMIRYQFSMISQVPISGLMRFVPLKPIEEMVRNLIKSRLDVQVNQFIQQAIRLHATHQEEQK